MSRLWGDRDYPHKAGHVEGSDTSKAAADAINTKLTDLHRKVYAHIRKVGGCTDEEGMAALAMEPNTYRPRRTELMTLGYVAASLDKRAGKSGALAKVWIITQKGL